MGTTTSITDTERQQPIYKAIVRLVDGHTCIIKQPLSVTRYTKDRIYRIEVKIGVAMEFPYDRVLSMAIIHNDKDAVDINVTWEQSIETFEDKT